MVEKALQSFMIHITPTVKRLCAMQELRLHLTMELRRYTMRDREVVQQGILLTRKA